MGRAPRLEKIDHPLRPRHGMGEIAPAGIGGSSRRFVEQGGGCEGAQPKAGLAEEGATRQGVPGVVDGWIRHCLVTASSMLSRVLATRVQAACGAGGPLDGPGSSPIARRALASDSLVA